MSEPGLSTQPSVLAGSPFETPVYKLSSDLAKLSLPSEYRDQYRVLAWVNSICFLFLLIGVVGLKAPRVIVKPLSEVNEPIPILLPPPEEQPKPQAIVQDDDTPPPTDAPVESVPVVPVVAVAETPGVAFPVRVVGAVAITDQAQLIQQAPIKEPPPQTPKIFDPNATDGGIYPEPRYPAAAERNRYQGTVVIEFTVDAAGTVTSVKVQKTSGFSVLDDAAMKVIKERWKFPPGAVRYYYKPFEFTLK